MRLPETGYHETTCFFTWMGEDGIARTQTKEGAVIEIDNAIENSKIVNDLAEPFYSLIVDSRAMKSMTKEAREHFTLKGRKSNVCSIAIIADSALSRMIANFFLGVSKPEVPVRIFSNEQNAIEWSMEKSLVVNGG